MYAEDIFKRGNIVWVDLPMGENSIQGGKRKALIISNDINNQYSPNIHIIPLTTKQKHFKLHLHRNNNRDYFCVEQLMVIPKEYVDTLSDIEKIDPIQYQDIYRLMDIQMGRSM